MSYLASKQTHLLGQGLRHVPGCLPQHQQNILITGGFYVAQTALSWPWSQRMLEKPGNREGLVLLHSTSRKRG